MIHKTIFPEVKIADEKAGIVEYVASDESLDRQQEIVRIGGWRFNRMEKNHPFVDSHSYKTIQSVVGKVLDARVDTLARGPALVETAQWAIDVPENKTAKLGWEMTKAGYLTAVSPGFLPIKLVTKRGPDDWPGDWEGARIYSANTRDGRKVWEAQAQEMGVTKAMPLRDASTIYIEHEQIELSACVIGCNPNALAKSYKAGVINDADLEWISEETAKRLTTATKALESDAALVAQRRRARAKFLDELTAKIKRL
jgi:hypothetical protein